LTIKPDPSSLRSAFGERLQENVHLANYTTAHVGGPADGLLIAQSGDELAAMVSKLWELDIPFLVLGTGANILVSDTGYRGVIVVNHAHTIKIDGHTTPPSVWAETGANIGTIARQCMLRGFSSLEWAGTIPGTLGGAVYGNAGAHGWDISKHLVEAEVVTRVGGKQTWNVEKMGFAYRSSNLKKGLSDVVVLAARLNVAPGTREEVQAKMSEYSEIRRSTQPPGASMGSMFKNPPGDKAGRLIESSDLKGFRIGGVEVSPIHANFFVNTESATAMDYYKVIKHVHQVVKEKTGVDLQMEIEFVGDWQNIQLVPSQGNSLLKVTL
jgi:UDP-N-acetylmuramate dehydrogenase